MESKSQFSFFWIEKQVIGGSTLPKSKSDLKTLFNLGIKHIISADSQTEVEALLKELKFPMTVFPIQIRDFGVPKFSDLINFVKYTKICITQNESIVIHCYAGCGRTGLLLMVYFLIFKNFSFEDALSMLRSIRPCAVETKSQEEFLKNLDIEKLRSFI